MPDPADPYGPRRSILPIFLLLIVALLIGMGGMAWLFHRYDDVAALIKPIPRPAPVTVSAPQRSMPLVNIAPAPAAGVVETIVDQRIGKIEDKVDDIDLRAQSATSDAQRAEGLLVAFAARRAIDRGVPLGSLESLLRERFGGVDPRAVATIISASRQPVTIDHLREQFAALEPQLATASDDDGWLEGFRRELSGLIVIRRTTTVSTAPIDRLNRAKQNLAADHVDAALVEIARLPGRKAAESWIADARRYVQAHAALDRIETAALLRPASPPAP